MSYVNPPPEASFYLQKEKNMGERILRRRAVLLKLGISSATLHRRIKDGTVPSPLRLGPNSVGWFESTIDIVMANFEPVTADTIKLVAAGARRGRRPKAVPLIQS